VQDREEYISSYNTV